jgi:hypothetical protein
MFGKLGYPKIFLTGLHCRVIHILAPFQLFLKPTIRGFRRNQLESGHALLFPQVHIFDMPRTFRIAATQNMGDAPLKHLLMYSSTSHSRDITLPKA